MFRYRRQTYGVLFVVLLVAGLMGTPASYAGQALSPILSLLLNDKPTLIMKSPLAGPNAMLADFYSPPVEFQGHLWFVAADTGYGLELWRTDGSNKVVRVTDINSGPEDTPLISLMVYKDALYYFAGDNTNGMELRRTAFDAVSGVYQTQLVKDIKPGVGDGIISNGLPVLVVFRGRLVFAGDDGVHGAELWMSDGTEAGTRRFADIAPGEPDISSPRYLTILPTNNLFFDDRLLFSASDAAGGRELWKISYSLWPLPGKFVLVRVADIHSGASGSDPTPLKQSSFTLFKNELYFSADNGTDGEELWKTNGATAQMVKNIGAGSDNGLSLPSAVGAEIFRDELYFPASGSSGSGLELWKTDGTEVGTMQAFTAGTAGHPVTILGWVWNDALYFSTLDSSDKTIRLWKRVWNEGANSWETYPLADSVLTGSMLSYYPGATVQEYRGGVYFTGTVYDENDVSVVSLYRLDGNDWVRKISGLRGDGESSSPHNFILYQNALYFSTIGEEETLKLWRFDP